MGDEISSRYFDAEHFSGFRERLEVETALLHKYFERREFSHRGNMAGFELEAWLVDPAGNPAPRNDDFLAALNDPLVVPELATFNVELNGSASSLSGRVFSRLYDELSATWGGCVAAAGAMDLSIASIGILPTITEDLLSSDHMSRMVRYHSLNDRLLAMRDGMPFTIEIEGDQDLSLTHSDVMMEAATTSFQIHLQCRPENTKRDFNASLAVSAPMVAASANSPFLFGHALWDETRIPLFEQAVDAGERYPPRVSFGHDYIRESLLEIFERNRREHPILLPALQDTPPDRFNHVRFHNGTLWRWNRPLIGFDHDGQVHLRIEHRVVPAGPTIRDCIANAAFYFGMIYGLRTWDRPVEELLTFDKARDNFYTAARYGLNARILWADAGGERECAVRTLILDELLPLARRGLESRDIPGDEIDEYLGIIADRVDTSQNGAAWQRRWVGLNGPDLNGLTLTYLAHQESGKPVHSWPL
ncbi:MAG: glutamate--cysteine ligase [Gammaproteobacteria bacterium]|nr:glutamate--cysteine ligase [Gammaproteobacteria bacterium]